MASCGLAAATPQGSVRLKVSVLAVVRHGGMRRKWYRRFRQPPPIPISTGARGGNTAGGRSRLSSVAVLRTPLADGLRRAPLGACDQKNNQKRAARCWEVLDPGWRNGLDEDDEERWRWRPGMEHAEAIVAAIALTSAFCAHARTTTPDHPRLSARSERSVRSV